MKKAIANLQTLCRFFSRDFLKVGRNEDMFSRSMPIPSLAQLMQSRVAALAFSEPKKAVPESLAKLLRKNLYCSLFSN